MNKKEIVKKFLTMIFIISFSVTGYFSVNKLIARKANASCCGCLCIGGGYAASVSAAGVTIVSLIETTTASIIAHIYNRTANIIGIYNGGTTPSSPPDYTYMSVPPNPDGVYKSIIDTRNHILKWINAFWYRQLEPALSSMSEQIMVMNADQSRTVSSFLDAANMIRMIMVYEDERVRAHREQRRGDNTVVIATLAGGLGRANTFKNAYNAVAPTENQQRSGNNKNKPSGAGEATDTTDRWDIYTGANGRYCRKDDNNGAAGCDDGDKLFVGQDIDVAKTIFLNETIKLDNPETKKTVDDLIVNIAEPFVNDIVPASAVNSATGEKAILEREAYKAKRQVIYDALYHVVSRRAPGSKIGTYVKQIRADAGVDINRQSDNPSYNEVLHAMISDRARSGKYALDQVNEPEVNKRELIIQEALQLMELNDQLDLLDKLSLVLAAQVGAEVKDMKSPGTGLSGASVN